MPKLSASTNEITGAANREREAAMYASVFQLRYDTRARHVGERTAKLALRDASGAPVAYSHGAQAQMVSATVNLPS